jgi:hypothetical protein
MIDVNVSTVKYWRDSGGKKFKHRLVGKKVYYRQYSEKVIDRVKGKPAGVVVEARHRGNYTTLLLKQGDDTHFATPRMLTTKKPKQVKK